MVILVLIWLPFPCVAANLLSEGGQRSDPSHIIRISTAKFSRKRLTGFSNP